MRARILLLTALVACGGGGGTSRDVFSPEPGARPSGFSPRPRPTEVVLRLPPPARLFAGTDSAAGTITVYCERERCMRDEGPPPRFLVAPQSGFVTFALHRAPLEARLEIATSSRAEPAIVPLNPGTLMAYGIDLGPGRYLLTLVARWQDAEARWLFRLRVPAG